MILHRMSRKDIEKQRKHFPTYIPNSLPEVPRFYAIILYKMMRRHDISAYVARSMIYDLLFLYAPTKAILGHG